MDRAELLPVEIVDALERGAVIVTGNQRAARTLRRGFDQRNRQLGLKSWTPAAVLAWDAWTAALVVKGEPKWLRHFFLCEISAKGFGAP